MKITLLLVAVCLVFSLASTLRVRQDKREVLINRPKIGTFGPKVKRSSLPGVKGQRPVQAPPTPLEMKVRKGEYVCGNRICKLQPGVVPKGCNGICQYPVK